MSRRRLKKPPATAGDKRRITLIEQNPSMYNMIVKGIETGLTYSQVAKQCGVDPSTLTGWMNRAREIIEKMEQLGLTQEQVDELTVAVREGTINNGENTQLIAKYGEGIITLVIERGFWLTFAKSLIEADVKAEARMLGVIRGAAIGDQSVTEERRKSVVVKDAGGEGVELPGEEVTTTTRQLKPQWQAAAWFLERKYPEKYSQKKVIQGELPPDIPYEVFMTAKTLLQLPKVELDRIIAALKEKLAQPRVISKTPLLPEKESK